ncbi:unnamed protein product [Polarella glacialis]|uniref:Protein kinase domain-containing protein n=1 Tax=Polarella glacialis TaxID=89957 RepID=A0A813I9R1_POLGL|nr:unnamed protein product [Polarella glacialis]
MDSHVEGNCGTGLKVWLHPTHQQGAVASEPRPWCPPLSESSTPQTRECAMRTLVEQAAIGFEPSSTRADLHSESFLANSSKPPQLLITPASPCFEVRLGKSNLLIASTCDPSLAMTASILEVDLLFSDIMWAAVPCADEHVQLSQVANRNRSTAPQYIVAVVPRPEDGLGTCSAGPAPISHGLPFQGAWLLCVGACSLADFQTFLRELGSRGAVRWDAKQSYHLDRELKHGTSSKVCLGQSWQRRPREIREEVEGRSVTAPASTPDVSATAVAVKCLKALAGLTDQAVKSEIAFLAQFRGHPNITQLYGVFCSREASGREAGDAGEQAVPAPCSGLRWSIVMELLPKGDLHDHLVRRGALPEADGLEMFCGVMSALAHLHFQRVVHRDVSADNILVSDQGRAVLADFGLAASLDDQLAMKENVGSPGYAAPEVVDDRPYGVKADVFSTGVVLYFALSNQLPFPGDVKTRVRLTSRCRVRFASASFGHLTGGVVALLRALLEKEPQQRPSSGRSFQASWYCLPSEVKHRSRATLSAFESLLPKTTDEPQQAGQEHQQLQQAGPEHQEQQQQPVAPTESPPTTVKTTLAVPTATVKTSLAVPTAAQFESPAGRRRAVRRNSNEEGDVFNQRSGREEQGFVSRLLDTISESRVPCWVLTPRQGDQEVLASTAAEGGEEEVHKTDATRLVLVPVPPTVPFAMNTRWQRNFSL